jgi:hypothetical protein
MEGALENYLGNLGQELGREEEMRCEPPQKKGSGRYFRAPQQSLIESGFRQPAVGQQSSDGDGCLLESLENSRISLC